MIQPESSKSKSGKREPRTSKKPRMTDPVARLEPVAHGLLLEPVARLEPELVDERCEPLVSEPLVSEPVELTETLVDLPVEEIKETETLVEKTLCPCGSIIATKSLSKHEKTKKHTAWLACQEITVVI